MSTSVRNIKAALAANIFSDEGEQRIAEALAWDTDFVIWPEHRAALKGVAFECVLPDEDYGALIAYAGGPSPLAELIDQIPGVTAGSALIVYADEDEDEAAKGVCEFVSGQTLERCGNTATRQVKVLLREISVYELLSVCEHHYEEMKKNEECTLQEEE
jgi:hypothetical protein